MQNRNLKLKVVIILPTYNEAENITPLINKLQKVFLSLKNYRFSILVVDDNSPDGTFKIVKNLQNKYKDIYLLIGSKKGLGDAYIRGMKYAVKKLKADIFFEMDADLSHDPKLIPFFLSKIEKGADLVIGSRYIKGGSIPKEWDFHRKVFSVFGNLIVRFGLMIPRIHEWTSGYRAIKTKVFEKIGKGLNEFTGYTFQVAFLHKATQAGFKVSEIPLDFIDRRYGKSKIAPLNYIANVFLYIFLNSSFIRFVITGLIGFSIDFTIAFILITSLSFYKPLANAISAAIAITSNFIINNYWSFSHKRISGGISVMVKKYGAFIMVATGSVAIQGIGMYIALTLFGDREIIILGNIPSWIIYKILIIIFVIIFYSYFMYNRFVWRKD